MTKNQSAVPPVDVSTHAPRSIVSLYSIYDIQAKTFLPPSMFPTHGVAIRHFGDLVAKDPVLSLHKPDFELYHVGHFDQDSGVCLSYQDKHPELVSRASDFDQS